jgi:hypothetical protein
MSHPRKKSIHGNGAHALTPMQPTLPESVTVIQAREIAALTKDVARLSKSMVYMQNQMAHMKAAMSTPALGVPMKISQLGRPARSRRV